MSNKKERKTHKINRDSYIKLSEVIKEKRRLGSMQNTLDKMSINEKSKVKKIDEKSQMRRRFLDIGLTDGTEVECVLVSYGGEMKAYNIKGAVIAIRKEDAKFIEIN